MPISDCDKCRFRGFIRGVPGNGEGGMFVCFIEDTMSYDDLVRADAGRCPRYQYDPMCEREGAAFRWLGRAPSI